MVVLDVAVPVYNEEGQLAQNIRVLRSYLDSRFPFPARVTIVDNASTDQTWAIATSLALELPGVRAMRLGATGRGRAVRFAWLASDAPVVAYMDVDLSTGLDALLPLAAPLISGHSDLAIGSRLAAGATVVRGLKRELISRAYNLVLHALLGTRVKDAQCGFKAMRTEVAGRLLTQVEDEAWFFDTELLVLAQRQGLRVHEVPVDWVDDPDSRVQLVPTAIADLRGIWRLSRELRTFAAIGLLSTFAYIGSYLFLRLVMPAWAANAVSLLFTCLANTEANRRITFHGARNGRLVQDHLSGLGALGVALAMTTVSLLALALLAPHAGRLLEVSVLAAATLLATGVRFVVLRTSITSAHRPRSAASWRAVETTA